MVVNAGVIICPVLPPNYAPFYDTEVTCSDTSTIKTSYSLTVLVRPFVGAYVSVGVDEMQFLVGLNGAVTTVNYKHVEDHKLPPHTVFFFKLRG
jgi:hypothetical protein